MTHKYRLLGSLLAGVLLLGSPDAMAQEKTKAAAATATKTGTDYFPAADMMTIGVYYYPEAWPEVGARLC